MASESEVRISLAHRGTGKLHSCTRQAKGTDAHYIGQRQRSLTRCGKLGGLGEATVFLVIALIQLLEAAAVHGGSGGRNLSITHTDLRSGQKGCGDALAVLQKGVLVQFPLQEVSTHMEVSVHGSGWGREVVVVSQPARGRAPSLT